MNTHNDKAILATVLHPTMVPILYEPAHSHYKNTTQYRHHIENP